ncbi:hypothetical protein [Phormidium nigroviride]|nr:hypothetical protein [Oscillatoria nigro-viridis]
MESFFILYYFPNLKGISIFEWRKMAEKDGSFIKNIYKGRILADNDG